MIRLLTNWKFTYTIAFAMVVGMVAIRIADPLPLQIMRNKTFDLFQQIKPRVEPEEGYPIGVRIIDLDDERRAAMVSNLLVVLCSDRHTQPVVNTGSLYQ